MPKLAVFLMTADPPSAPEPGPAGAFLKVDGRECLLRAAEVFVNREEVVQTLTCFEPEADEEGRRRFGNHLMFTGVKLGEPVEGWYGQVASMAKKIEAEATHVLIHDAARPAVAFDDLDSLFEATDKAPDKVHASALPAVTDGVTVDAKGRPMGHTGGPVRPLIWPRVYPVAMLEALAGGKEPTAKELVLVDSRPTNVRCGGPAGAKFVAAMIKQLPQRKKDGPLNPFEEAQW